MDGSFYYCADSTWLEDTRNKKTSERSQITFKVFGDLQKNTRIKIYTVGSCRSGNDGLIFSSWLVWIDQ